MKTVETPAVKTVSHTTIHRPARKEKNNKKGIEPIIGVSLFLALWIALCVKSDMYITQSIIASTIIFGAVFLGSKANS